MSEASESLPTSRVPPAETRSMPAVKEWLPAPKEMTAPVPMSIVSQFETVAPASDPEVFRKARVFEPPPPPSSAVSPPMAPPLNVSDVESFASLIAPLMAAPLSTMTLSQFFRPWDTTVACRLPAPPVNLSVSSPAPPSKVDALEKLPPAKTISSAPPSRSTDPMIDAPDSTRTRSFESLRIALRPTEPTMAPLPSVILVVAPVANLMAALLPEPPVTMPDTEMLMIPLDFAKMPWSPLDATFPDISISIVAELLASMLMPCLFALMEAPLATATPILRPVVSALIPLLVGAVTASRTRIETSGPEAKIPSPVVPRIGPDATTVNEPAPVTAALTPLAPVTEAALIVRLPRLALASMPAPDVAMTTPVAVTDTSPPPFAYIPRDEPVTEPAAIVTPTFEEAWMPSPASPVTLPDTSMEILPPLLLLA